MSPGEANYYVDGEPVGTEQIGKAQDDTGKYAMEDVFYLFKHSSETFGGFISSLQFRDEAAPAAVIAELDQRAPTAFLPSHRPSHIGFRYPETDPISATHPDRHSPEHTDPMRPERRAGQAQGIHGQALAEQQATRNQGQAGRRPRHPLSPAGIAAGAAWQLRGGREI